MLNVHQGLSQDLGTGRPQLIIVKCFEGSIFPMKPQNTQTTIINKYLLIKHNVDLQYHGNYIEVKGEKIILCLKLTLRNFSHKSFGVLKGDF